MQENSGETCWSRPSEPVSLGEMNRDSLKPSVRERSLRRPTQFFWASEYLAQARGVSPKRDPALAPVSFFEPSPRWRGLVWASTSRLSKTLQPEQGVGRGNTLFGCLVAFGWLIFVWVWLLCWEIYIMDCYACVT